MQLKKMILALFLSLIPLVATAELDALGNPINYSSAEKCSVRDTAAVQLRCVAYHQTTGYTCGPAAAMTILHYYGMLNGADMNAKTEMRMATEMGTTSDGTTMSQLADWLSNHGLRVTSGSNVSSDVLMNSLKQGNPVIIGFGNHWIVAKGYNGGGSNTYMNQPEFTFADSCCGIRVIPKSVIESTSGPSIYKNQCSSINYIIATR